MPCLSLTSVVAELG
uniref:Uncharacterized protein n=1 Tax=Arundo donax TaxID=35708 RepID=A0A0A9C7Y4_ARUDO